MLDPLVGACNIATPVSSLNPKAMEFHHDWIRPTRFEKMSARRGRRFEGMHQAPLAEKRPVPLG
ncbi:MAG: hypothetical protein IPG92_06585 [Flavobacteriales bacterium]|nr:hypothetical protein [Flavobacteriales bacterium]